MNSKKFIPVMLAVLLLTCAIAAPAMASVDVATCSIVRVGYDPRFSGAMVQLDDMRTMGELWTGARQFYLSSALGNQGLATLLTAYSMGKTVWVRISGTATSGSLVEIIFINN
ncbi:MAG: hypothetical protein AB2L11_01800 [Syntrophobacteraceae bacterium]